MKGSKGIPADYRPADRRCLGPCGKVFASMGPGLRLCPRCAKLRDGRLLSKRQCGVTRDVRVK